MHVTGIEPHTLWVMTNPAVEQCTKLLSHGDIYKIPFAVHVNEFLIVFEKRILVPDMTPEPLLPKDGLRVEPGRMSPRK